MNQISQKTNRYRIGFVHAYLLKGISNEGEIMSSSSSNPVLRGVVQRGGVSVQGASEHVSRADALNLWYDVTLAGVRSNTPDLTARQMAVLFTVYLTPAPHTVRSLAAHLEVTKAVITRALDALGKLGFIDRARDPRDARSVLVQRTGRGSSYLTDFADRVRGPKRFDRASASAANRVMKPKPPVHSGSQAPQSQAPQSPSPAAVRRAPIAAASKDRPVAQDGPSPAGLHLL